MLLRVKPCKQAHMRCQGRWILNDCVFKKDPVFGKPIEIGAGLQLIAIGTQMIRS